MLREGLPCEIGDIMWRLVSLAVLMMLAACASKPPIPLASKVDL